MLPAGVQMWRLSDAGDGNLGLSCDRDGLFLGRTALIEKREGCYAVHPRADLDRLLKFSSATADLE